jgi:two-component sensor histidine kinase
MSLKQGLFFVVLAALMPIGITSIVQSIANWNSMQDAALEGLAVNAKAIAERERDAFIVTNRLLRVAATNPDIKSMSSRCSEVLRTGFAGLKPIVNFIRVDTQGFVRCSLLPFRPGASIVSQPWWKKAKIADSMVISQPTIGTVSGVPIIAIVLPLKDDSGAFAGVFSAGVDISQLQQSIGKAPEAKTGVIAIVSSSGETVVVSDRRNVKFDFRLNLSSNRTGPLRTTQGEAWIYHAVPLAGNDLYVIYAKPRSEIFSVALSQLRASIILPLLAIFLTLCAIWFGTNRLVIRWLDGLRHLSDDMTKGNFEGNRQAFADAPLELRELSDDLHDMAFVIHSRTNDLTKALDAKTRLTREVHHRVKNNLQIISSLLTMQASRMIDENARTALEQTRVRVVALALIHRLSYEQDSESEEPEVTIEALMGELCRQLRYNNRLRCNVTLTFMTSDFALPVDLAVPFALFIVEAVTNSFRHAFPEGAGGTIEMSFNRDGESAILTISDSGQGYDVGTSAGRDLGTELMQGFATQLNGKIAFSSDLGKGSVTTLRFATKLEA